MTIAPLAVPPLARTPAQDGRIHVLEVIGNAIVGGMESWVARTLERLPRERYAFSALCPFESAFTDRLRAMGVDVLVTPMPEDPPWSTIQNAAALVAAGEVDLLHAHLPRAHLLAGIVGRLTNTPVLATVHGRMLGTLDLEVHRAAGSHVSVVCRQAYYHALGLGFAPARLSCEPNGVDVEAFRPRPRGASSLRASLGLGAEVPLVGFVGRLSAEKGPEVVVRAAMLLRSRCPQAHTVLAGDGPMEGELRALIARFGLEDRVHLAGVREDMPLLHPEFDLLVCSSHTEAMPFAVMEAMACGVPVVATRVGGVPEIVDHGGSGLLVADGDFEDIAAQCAMLLGDAPLRERMGACARRRVVERLPLDAAVERVDRLLQRVARHPPLATVPPHARATPALSPVRGSALRDA